MSDFWAKKLGLDSPRSAGYTRTPAPATNPGYRPWWDVTPAPAQQVDSQPAPSQQQTGLTEADKQRLARVMNLAKSARLTETCPECGSGNYMHVEGSNARKRCFDCGFPVVQSGSGGLPADGGPATPAAQIHDGSSNYRPKQPFHHIR